MWGPEGASVCVNSATSLLTVLRSGVAWDALSPESQGIVRTHLKELGWNRQAIWRQVCLWGSGSQQVAVDKLVRRLESRELVWSDVCRQDRKRIRQDFLEKFGRRKETMRFNSRCRMWDEKRIVPSQASFLAVPTVCAVPSAA